MLGKLRKIIFLLIVLFLSSQVGLHFWPEFAKVSGIRIDYLSPTLYLLDILILAWLALRLRSGWLRQRLMSLTSFRIKNHFLSVLFLLFILSLVWNLFLARSPGAHIFGIVKLVEFGLFGWLVAKTFGKKDISVFVRVLALSAIVSSLLAIWQFIKQSSVGGLWYFFGERTFNISTIGISTVNLDQQILRPYGAFPHPNVLAFFLVATIVFAFMRIPYEKKLAKIFLIISILFSSVALVLSFSRILIIIAICFLIYAIYTKGKRNALYFVPILIIMFVLLGYFVSEVFSPQFLFRGIDFRQELLFQSFDMIIKNPYFGVGLNNFFIHQSALIKDISPILFQPPHNIFIIALLSLGIFGWWIFPAVFIYAIRSLTNKLKANSQELKAFHKSVLFVLISIIVVGMVDHFFLTLEQGQIILVLILGLSFAKLKN